VVDKVAPGLLLRIIWFSAVSAIPPIFHTHTHTHTHTHARTHAHTHTFHSPTADAIPRIILTTWSVVEHVNITYFECSYAARTFAYLCRYVSRIIRSQYRISNECYSLSVGIVMDTVTRGSLG
jgi:hypothetical protein